MTFRVRFGGPPQVEENDDNSDQGDALHPAPTGSVFERLIAAAEQEETQLVIDTAAAHVQVQQRGARCLECPLYQKRLGPVKSVIRPHARLTVIGEAPGKQEVEQKAPFVGKSGVELDAALEMGGLARNHINIFNVIACKPDIEGGSLNDYLQRIEVENGKRKESGKPLLLSPIEACQPRLQKDLDESGTQVELAVGGRALEALCDRYKLNYGKGADHVGSISVATIKNQHGSPIVLSDHNKIICSSLHPAFAMRGARAYKHVIRNDIARACRIAVRGYVDWKMPSDDRIHLWPTLPKILELMNEWRLLDLPTTVDIETDSADTQDCRIRCIGLGTVHPERGEEVIVIPVRYMSGQDYWGSRDFWTHHRLRLIKEAVRSLMDEAPLVAHNGMFDTQVLLNDGWMSDRTKLWHDTMLLDHDTDANDLPHDLGAVTRRYFEAPLWKKMVDHKAAAGVSQDSDLHIYNSIDVTTTMRLEPALQERVAQNGTHQQYATDQKLGPVARDMEVLGLFVDEEERARLSEKLNKLCFALRDRFWKHAGSPINPRSPPQLVKWLYDEEGLEPPLNSQGYEWKEGDSKSTGASAITTLLSQGVRPELAKALQTLLEYKKAEKLRSTYVDRIRVRYDSDFDYLGRLPPVILDAVDESGKTERVETLPSRGRLSRLHPTWKIHVVPTGRWASSPNAQNIPSQAWGGLNLKTQYVAPPGHVIVGADYEQIELRIYAVQANDQLILQAFHEGLDPHCLNAATLLSPKDDDGSIMDLCLKYMKMKKSGVEKEEKEVKHYRTIAKRFAYLETYGGEEGKLFSTMAFERDKTMGKLVFPGLKASDVERWHERWHLKHPETRQWQDGCAAFQRIHGYVQALGDQRRRFFPGGPDRKNQVANHTIQGSAAYIANSAVLRIAEAIPFFKWSRYSGLCLQVHDYIGVYVPEAMAARAIAMLTDLMYAEIKGMPFPVDTPKATKCWSDQD